MGFKNSSAAKF